MACSSSPGVGCSCSSAAGRRPAGDASGDWPEICGSEPAEGRWSGAKTARWSLAHSSRHTDWLTAARNSEERPGWWRKGCLGRSRCQSRRSASGSWRWRGWGWWRRGREGAMSWSARTTGFRSRGERAKRSRRWRSASPGRWDSGKRRLDLRTACCRRCRRHCRLYGGR